MNGHIEVGASTARAYQGKVWMYSVLHGQPLTGGIANAIYMAPDQARDIAYKLLTAASLAEQRTPKTGDEAAPIGADW